jgi:hypothetical protein
MRAWKRRERALNDMSAVIRKMWGARCNRHDGHCPCCNAWDVFDMIERITDSAVLDVDRHAGDVDA